MAMKKATFDDLVKSKKPRQMVVKIYLEDEPIERFNKLSREYARMELMGAKVTKKALDAKRLEVEKAREAARMATREIVVQAMGRKNYEELVEKHPPTEEDHKQARESVGKPDDKSVEADFCFATFAPELIAKSIIEPEMTLEQVQTLFDEWNTQEIIELYQAAMIVNTTRRVAEWGND